MRRLLGSLAALTAALVGGCFDDHGLAIVVDVGATGATKVELFIATQACADNAARGIDCDAMTPSGAAVRIPGDIWFRDANARIQAEVGGHSASFRLETAEPQHLERAIAVGRDSNGAIVGVVTLQDLDVPVSAARLLEVALATAEPLGATQSSQAKTGEYVRVWPEDQVPTSTCVAVEHRTDAGVTRDFIVPTTDADCDGIEDANDCNPAAYKGSDAEDNKDGKAECLATSGGLCLYGDRGCKDGEARDTREGCYPQHTPTCVPSLVCTGCAGKLDRACLDAVEQMPRIACTWSTTVGECVKTVVVSLEKYLPDGCGEAPGIAALGSGPDDAPRFEPSMRINASEIAIAATTTASGGCAVKLTWSTSGQLATDEVAVIQLATARGRVVLPIRFAANASITTCVPSAFQCDPPEAGASDSMWACVAP